MIISANERDVTFSNNNSTGTQDGTGTGIYVAAGNLSLVANAGKTIEIGDAISIVEYGASGGKLSINDGGKTGIVSLLNSITATTTELNGGVLKLGDKAAESTFNNFIVNENATLDLANNNAGDSVRIDNLTVAGGKKLNLTLEFDGSKATNNIDTLEIGSVGGGGADVYLDSINIINDGNASDIARYITGTGANNLFLRTDSIVSTATSGGYIYIHTNRWRKRCFRCVARFGTRENIIRHNSRFKLWYR